MNISHPDKNSEVYKQFIDLINQKVANAITWLAERNIDYIWNYQINGHLYRLYIPCKDLLLDFEYYPVNDYEYNYIRVNYDTDIEILLEKLFPKNIYNTEDLTVWKLSQRYCNRFLKENNRPAVYGKDILRLAWVDKDKNIYQCIVIKDDKIIANVTKRNCSVLYGTYMMLRYLTEMFGFDEILIKESTENSYTNTIYRLINAEVIKETNKIKIWWSPKGTKWKIEKEQTSQFIPFYFCENRIYKYK